jgi:hypothetical protein
VFHLTVLLAILCRLHDDEHSRCARYGAVVLGTCRSCAGAGAGSLFGRLVALCICLLIVQKYDGKFMQHEVDVVCFYVF